MKLSFTLIILTTLVAVVVETTWAKPNPQFNFNIGVGGHIGYIARSTPAPAAGDEGAVAFLNAALNAADKGGNILENIINEINEAIRDATEGLKNNDISNTTSNTETRNLVNENLDNFNTFVNTFISSLGEKIQNVKNIVKINRLKEVQKGLQELEKGLSDLQTNYEAVQITWQNYDDNKTAIISNIDKWASEQLEKVSEATSANEDKIAEAKKILDDSVKGISDNIQKSVDGPEADFRKFANQVNSIMAANEPRVLGLVREVVQCLQDTDTSAAAARCSRGFNLYLNKIRSVPRDAAKLKKGGANLAAQNIENNECVGRALIAFSLEKSKVEQQLKELEKDE